MSKNHQKNIMGRAKPVTYLDKSNIKVAPQSVIMCSNKLSSSGELPWQTVKINDIFCFVNGQNALIFIS